MLWALFLRRITLLLPMAFVVAGCSLGTPNAGQNAAPTPTVEIIPLPTAPDKAATPQLPTIPGALPSPTIVGAPTATASVPIAQPTTAPQPAIVPTAAPPIATISPAAALVGPEWTIAALGDQNQDGQIDVVAYKPAAIAVRQPVPGFNIIATELVVVQQGSAGPETQLGVNIGEIFVPNFRMASFPTSGGPAAFLVQVGPGAIGIVPLNGAGDVVALGASLYWDGGAGGYRPTALAGAPVVNAGPPLVGPEWQISSQGDLNGNGRRDVVVFKAGPAVALQGGYGLSVGEIAIVEEGLFGRAELQMSLDPQRLFVPGQSLVDYPAQIRPIGFLANIAQSGTIVSFAPVDANGQPFTRGAKIIWDQGALGYRPTGDSELLPPVRALLGPEWTVALDGDANGDGQRDVIAYKPAGIQVRPPNTAYRLVASEVVIVQENGAGPYGQPEVQLAINTREMMAPNTPLVNYLTSDPNRTIGAFLLNVTPNTGIPMALLPVNTAGAPVNDLAIAAYWDTGVAAYRIRPTGGGLIPPVGNVTTPAAPKSLVGSEWTVLAQGDFNGDGRRDVVAYKPGSVASRAIDPSMPYNTSQLVIVQEGSNGQPELQLDISPSQVFVPGNVLTRYGTPPSGFLVGIAGQGVSFIPLGATGEPLGQRTTLTWNAGQTLYLP